MFVNATSDVYFWLEIDKQAEKCQLVQLLNIYRFATRNVCKTFEIVCINSYLDIILTNRMVFHIR